MPTENDFGFGFHIVWYCSITKLEFSSSDGSHVQPRFEASGRGDAT